MTKFEITGELCCIGNDTPIVMLANGEQVYDVDTWGKFCASPVAQIIVEFAGSEILNQVGASLIMAQMVSKEQFVTLAIPTTAGNIIILLRISTDMIIDAEACSEPVSLTEKTAHN